MRHNSKYNRYERRQMQQEKLAQSLKGGGHYVYKNPSKTGTVSLPKEIAPGKRTLGPNEEFVGDSYFMTLVHSQDLMLVKIIKSVEQERAEAAANSVTKTDVAVVEEKPVAEEHVLTEAMEDKTIKPRQNRKAENMTPQKNKKLLLDQPDKVTTEGKVEHVVRQDSVQKLHDHDNKQQPDVLLNEHPAGEIIIE